MRFLVPVLALALAAPAGAQIVGRHDYGDVQMPPRFGESSRLAGPGIWRDVRDVRDRIERAEDSGQISRGDARRFDRQARLIGRLAERYGRDGLSPWEASELEARAHALRGLVSARALRDGGR